MSDLKPSRQAFAINRKRFGTLLTWPDGRQAVMIDRSRRDVFTDTESRINEAIDQGVACWSVETLILSRMRMRKIQILIINVRQDRELFLTTLRQFELHSTLRNRRVKNGSVQRTLSFDRFLRKTGRVKI